MGQEPDFIKDYAKAFVSGLQQVDLDARKVNGVLGSVKHFFGDGAPLYGAD